MLVTRKQRLVTPSIEDVIRLGRIEPGDLTFPAKLAKFAAIMREPQTVVERAYRRLGTVGNISAINPATQSQLALAWDVAVSQGNSTGRYTGPNQADPTQFRAAVAYTFGSSGVNAINQIAQKTFTVTNGTPNNFAMDVWAFNVVNDASATFTAIKEWWVELLSVAQGGGAASTGITCGNHATNAWVGILSATGTYTIGSGGMWRHQDQSSAGLTVNSGDITKIINNDASHVASVRITAVGFK